MAEGIAVEFDLGAKGWADAWERYLPKNSEAITHFREPLSMMLRYDPPRRTLKVFGDGVAREVEDMGQLVDEFSRLWVEVLNCVGRMPGELVQLVYFLGEAADLFSLWSYLPADSGDDRRFFVSQMCKDSRQHVPVTWGRVCVEYSYEDLKRFAGSHEFFFSYSTVMGVCVRDACVGACLPMDALDKDVLEQTLRDESLRCWWFCDSDFDNMTICHKDFSGAEILSRLKETEWGKSLNIGTTP
jgi:hypothetical protein